MAPHRVFSAGDEWMETVMVIPSSKGLGDERIFTCGSHGRLTHWKLDAEQNCDVYQIEVYLGVVS